MCNSLNYVTEQTFMRQIDESGVRPWLILREYIKNISGMSITMFFL